MNEQDMAEVERALLSIGDAEERTAKAAAAIRKNGNPAWAAALEEAERELGDTYRKLTHNTYYATPQNTLELPL